MLVRGWSVSRLYNFTRKMSSVSKLCCMKSSIDIAIVSYWINITGNRPLVIFHLNSLAIYYFILLF
jgi:hypothetical protein